MKFLKLTTIVINTNHISAILIRNNKYIISTMNPGSEGFFLCGSGAITSPNTIEISKETQREDYDGMTEWLTTL